MGSRSSPRRREREGEKAPNHQRNFFRLDKHSCTCRLAATDETLSRSTLYINHFAERRVQIPSRVPRMVFPGRRHLATTLTEIDRNTSTELLPEIVVVVIPKKTISLSVSSWANIISSSSSSNRERERERCDGGARAQPNHRRTVVVTNIEEQQNKGERANEGDRRRYREKNIV